MTARPLRSLLLMSRRRFVGAAAGSTALALTGCLESEDGTTDTTTPDGTTPDGTSPTEETITPDDDPNTLNATEKENLLFLREEEKLARDVYHALDAEWGGSIGVFASIESSEQSHMDAVLALLDSYGLTDPASPEYGVFNDDFLQTLYGTLVADGGESLEGGITVGCFIEDYDIHDIDVAMMETTNPDILSTLENLQLGSRNHMRSFYGALEDIAQDAGLVVNDYGYYYTPKYISQETFEEIVNSAMEMPSPQKP